MGDAPDIEKQLREAQAELEKLRAEKSKGERPTLSEQSAHALMETIRDLKKELTEKQERLIGGDDGGDGGEDGEGIFTRFARWLDS